MSLDQVEVVLGALFLLYTNINMSILKAVLYLFDFTSILVRT